MSSTPDSTLSASSSQISLPDHLDSDNSSPPSTSTSASSSPRSRSPVTTKNGFLAPPAGVRTTLSRSPSPLGLIPVHRTFSKFVHKHEIPRKALHVSIGFLAIYLYRTEVHPNTLIAPLTTALIPIVSADILRLRSESFNQVYIKVLGALMRESEVKGWNGVIWYLVGTVAVMVMFPKDVATLSIALLSWCDTAASTFGRLWGRHTMQIRKGKSLAGSLAAAAVGAMAAGFWWGWVIHGVSQDGGVMWRGRLGIAGMEITGGLALTVMSLVTGLVASASEMLDLWGLDDNVIIPVVSGAGIWGLLKVFG
ncbi:hypothetical protein BZA77DRAFT_39053 [Pyronema omphalodes]|nr:hypothetical protein BZA77DRAFT_39053 [Pyronema omphalodes]